jgi:glycosyltransferase involved in cell wall biosynthesis
VTTPKFSVVIPTYNQAQFLGDAVDSVLAQTFKDYELILVNDGSTDNTEDVGKRYGEKIRYLHQENQGLAGARNSGVYAAEGQYVAFLDSDDIWDPTFLESMLQSIEKNFDSAVFYCGIRYIDKDKNQLPQRGGLEVASEENLLQQLLRANFIIPSATVIKRSVLLELDGFDINFRRLQDYELWIRLLRSGYSFTALKDQYLVSYRVHGNNLSTDPVGAQQAAKLLINKHFGADDGHWTMWSAEKRLAYGGLYRFCLLNSIQRQNDWQSGVVFLYRSLVADPSLAVDVDLFYELALGSQPVGYRGTDCQLDLEQNAKHIETLLADLFVLAEEHDIQENRSVIYGSAFKAIGMAAYNTGKFALCRKYLRLALRHQPGLVRERWIVNLFVKTFMRKSFILRIQKIVKNSNFADNR